jgi:hypothetical protein
VNEFDSWLEDELAAALGSAAPATPPAAPAYRGIGARRRLSLASALPLAVGTKFAAGLAVAALAAGGTATVVVSTHVAGHGSVGEVASGLAVGALRDAEGGSLGTDAASSNSSSASSGDASTANHGSAVTSAVSSCKESSSSSESVSSTTTETGHEGIGQCVAGVASDPRADRTETSSTSSAERGKSGTHPTPPPDRPTPPPHP